MRSFNLSAWAVHHRPLVLFLVLLLAVGGSVSYLRLGRAEDPSFTIKVANVIATWPGATAEEMQNQVADPIEKKAQDLPWFDHVQTYAKPSFLAMQVFFKDTTPPRETPWLFYLLRKKLIDVRGELPAGLIGPDVNDEFGDVDSVLYMVSGEDADYGQLKKLAESMRQRLLDAPDVVKVNLYGLQDPRIFVEFSQPRLASLGVAPQTIFDSLARQNDVAASGMFETNANRTAVRISGAMSGAEA
ncbi:MAG: efflux RND transporter permease subunit, partial [Xanthobacteraceae bacterium]